MSDPNWRYNVGLSGLYGKNLVGESLLKWLRNSKRVLLRIPIENNNRMSFNSSKKLKASERRSEMLHVRLREYFKIFTSFINFETFFVIAYRDLLVKIDMTNERDSAIVFQQKLDDMIVNMSLIQGADNTS